jgi:hypothetical protein
MLIFTLTRDYIIWHYTVAYADIVHIWWNYLWFINHLFAVPEVFASWLAPFKRLTEEKVKFLKSPQDFFANMFVNLIMRIVGAIIRTAIVCIACIGFVSVLLIGFSFLFLWTVLPILVIRFFTMSITVFFS